MFWHKVLQSLLSDYRDRENSLSVLFISLPLRTAHTSAIERSSRTGLMPAQPTTECCPAEPAHPHTRQPWACQPLGRVLRELRRLSGQVTLCIAASLRMGRMCRAKPTLSHANCLPEYKATRATFITMTPAWCSTFKEFQLEIRCISCPVDHTPFWLNFSRVSNTCYM